MKRIGNPFGGIFKKLQYAILNKLPRQTKRLLFIASVYLDLGSERELSQEELLTLNDRLKIARDPYALDLPVVLHSAHLLSFGEALRDIPERIKGHLDEEAYLRDICQQIITLTPAWMFYGRRSEQYHSDMINDLMTMFGFHPNINRLAT